MSNEQVGFVTIILGICLVAIVTAFQVRIGYDAYFQSSLEALRIMNCTEAK